jgi:hypothetical protein
MAQCAVAQRGVSIRLACELFTVSVTCYRYVAKRRAENEEMADWLIRLSDNQRTWGFGLCYLYLRNVQGFAWNHKRVYRIYCELELNLRIKPRKRLQREKLETINQVWSMDFMHDQLGDGRNSGCSTSSMTSIERRWGSRSTSRCPRSASSGGWRESSSGAGGRMRSAATMGRRTSAA